IADTHERMALATIIQVQGSSPRHPGTRMLVGVLAGRQGTVGGGRGEALAEQACLRSLEDGQPSLLRVEMLGESIAGQEMVCGGIHTLLVEPLDDLAPYRIASGLLSKGRRVAFVKRIRIFHDDPSTVEVGLLDQDGDAVCGELDADARPMALRALRTGQPVFDEATRTYVEPAFPEEKLLILGGGHVGQALAAAAPALGFRVTVVDDRPELMSRTGFPAGVRIVVAPFEEAVGAFPFDAATYAVIVTRGHQTDLECLRAVLKRDYRYAGFMGSARKTRFLLDQVLQDGFAPAKVDALWAPIGLGIDAETPEELATAILGEMIAVRRNAGILPRLKQARLPRRTATRSSVPVPERA
ncbi:MAG TPA: XdhC family protein, partial [Holophaga sp.]|nr:XdhC family protein [Holophaga sp.]